MTPPEFVNGLEPNEPAKNRRMMTVQIFCAPQPAALKMANAPYVLNRTTWRPQSSDIGAKKSGPIANPNT